MPSHPSSEALTDKRQSFVKNYVAGMSQTAAARTAGFKFPTVEACQLMKLPVIQEAIRVERNKYEMASNMTKRRVIDGLKEAIDIARTTSEPASMVGGWREIAKICGYYAPETRRVDITVSGAQQLSQIESMTDEELVKAIIEGQYTDVTDEDAIPAIPIPQIEDDGRDPEEDLDA